MADPNNATTHYGWALWHLEQVATADADWALVHATAANARAALAQIDAADGRFEGSTWSGDRL